MDISDFNRKSVSVVIVNYNGGALLTECVRSVLQSSVLLKVFVSDNGSHDESIAYLRSALGNHPLLEIKENHRNLGFAKGNNVALPQCGGDYLLFLNPDCIVKPDTLEQMIEVMEQHPEAGMAGCLLVNPDGTEQVGCRRFVPTPWRSMVRVLRLSQLVKNHPRFQPFTMKGLPLPDVAVPIEAISGAFMLVRREALVAVGPMDENYFLHCEDLDWCMRFRQAGWKILFVPHVRSVHWKGLSSKAHPVAVEFHKHRGMVRFYNKFFRHQYPGGLMVLVIAAVCLRFMAKAAWISTRRVFAPKHPASDAVPPLSSASSMDKEQGTPAKEHPPQAGWGMRSGESAVRGRGVGRK
jgi:GT2 family glycosyltransferase